jgi:hypothetical protein
MISGIPGAFLEWQGDGGAQNYSLNNSFDQLADHNEDAPDMDLLDKIIGR